MDYMDGLIHVAVRGAFDSAEDIIENITEAAEDEGDEFDPNDIKKKVRAAIAQLKKEQLKWPAKTDCDRLDLAFEELNKKGIIALQNAGYTQSDGCSDVAQIYEDAPDKERYVGYCFYHGQDLERAIKGEGLLFSFGPMNSDDEETLGPKVAQTILAVFEKFGLRAGWEGHFQSRIGMELDWKRRWVD